MRSLPTFSSIFSSSIKKVESNRANVRLQGVSSISPTNDPFESRLVTSTITEGFEDDAQVTSDMTDMIERNPASRNPEDLIGYVYYQLEFSVTVGTDQQSIFAVLEIPPNYPLRTPQFLLTPRSTSVSSTQSYSYISTLRAFEQEVNVGCLLALENLGESFFNKNEKLEEALDNILSVQLSTLLALFTSGATFDNSNHPMNSLNAADRSTGNVIGRNRNSSVLSKLYGRSYLGVN